MATLEFQINQIKTQQNKELDFMFKQAQQYGELKKNIIKKVLELQQNDFIINSDIDLLKAQIKQMIEKHYIELEIAMVKFNFEGFIQGYLDVIEIGMVDIDGKVSRKSLETIKNSENFQEQMKSKYNISKNDGLTKKNTFKDTLTKREQDFKRKISLMLENFKGELNAQE